MFFDICLQNYVFKIIDEFMSAFLCFNNPKTNCRKCGRIHSLHLPAFQHGDRGHVVFCFGLKHQGFS